MHSSRHRPQRHRLIAAAAILTGAIMALVPAVSASAAVAAPVVVTQFNAALPGSLVLLKSPLANVLYATNGGGGNLSINFLTTGTSTTQPLVAGGTRREIDENQSTARLYVTSTTGVDVFDSTTGTPLFSFAAAAGTQFWSLAIDPGTGNLLVASNTDSQAANAVIQVRDPSTGALLSEHTVPGGALSQFGLNASTGVLYAKLDNSVIAIRLSDFAVTATTTGILPSGSVNPNGLAVDPTTGHVMASTATNSLGEITVLDGTTLAAVQTINLGTTSYAASISYFPLGNYLVATLLSPDKPRLIDLSDGSITTINAVPTGLNRGLYVDPTNGYIYIAGTTNRVVTVLAVAPDIRTTTLPNTTLATTYTSQVNAVGSLPISFAVTSGSLPPGITLDPTTGALSGTSTTSGTYPFTVTATNTAGTDTQAYEITVADPPTITTTTLPDGVTDAAYTATVTATGANPITYSVTAGTLPPGLQLSNTGTLTGTPTTAGTYTFTVTATNQYGSDTVDYSIDIITAPQITSTAPPAGVQGAPYTHTVTASGTGPITFTVSGGTLPPGLTLDPTTGIISGTPTTAGTYAFAIAATNAAGSDTQTYQVTITSNAVVPTSPPSSPAAAGTTGSGPLASTGLDLPLAGAALGLPALVMISAGAVLAYRRRRTS